MDLFYISIILLLRRKRIYHIRPNNTDIKLIEWNIVPKVYKMSSTW